MASHNYSTCNTEIGIKGKPQIQATFSEGIADARASLVFQYNAETNDYNCNICDHSQF